ncbi:MAG: endonuclease/exonuclease/phosphatase family protein [Gammaproteobacteria bacterium]
MSRFRELFKAMPALALFGCIGATAAAYAAKWHWLLALFSHFHMQYVMVLLTVTLFYAWQRRFLGLSIAVICGGLNVLPITNVFATDADTQTSRTEPWVLFSANLHGNNNNVAAVLDQLAAEQATVVVLQEYTFRWASDLARLRDQYPHHVEFPRDDNFGLALYSRWPLVSAEAISLGGSTAAIVADLESPNGPLRIITVHLRPPLSEDWAAQQTRQFDALTEFAIQADIPLAVAGDFNATPWSPNFKRWIDTARLQNGIQSGGPAYTWPTGLPIFRIPIDACVVNNGLRVIAQRRGSPLGSDHYPLVTTLVTSHD